MGGSRKNGRNQKKRRTPSVLKGWRSTGEEKREKGKRPNTSRKPGKPERPDKSTEELPAHSQNATSVNTALKKFDYLSSRNKSSSDLSRNTTRRIFMFELKVMVRIGVRFAGILKMQ